MRGFRRFRAQGPKSFSQDHIRLHEDMDSLMHESLLGLCIWGHLACVVIRRVLNLPQGTPAIAQSIGHPNPDVHKGLLFQETNCLLLGIQGQPWQLYGETGVAQHCWSLLVHSALFEKSPEEVKGTFYDIACCCWHKKSMFADCLRWQADFMANGMWFSFVCVCVGRCMLKCQTRRWSFSSAVAYWVSSA